MAQKMRNKDVKSEIKPERPKSSLTTEQRRDPQRVPLKNRFSSPPGSLILGEQDFNSEFNSVLRVPSPDIGRRPGLSRRHYYGSLEALNTLNSNYESTGVTSKYRIENGEISGLQNGSPSSSQGNVVHLENPEFQTRWYFKYFLGKVHQNYIGVDGKQNPFILSICLTAADNYDVPQYRAILWKKTGSEKICVPYHASKPVSAKVLVKSFGIEKCEKGPKEVLSPEFQQELLTLEEQEGSVNFKFGVLYAKAGQTSDDEMFSNETGSDDFNNFLDLLGDRVVLQGWQRYRGGLDVKNDMTGSQSVFTIYEGHEIMFHVSSLLPYTPDNPQQVERKRHIGNDIVTVVFQDTENEDDKPSFTPMGVKSKFIHVFVLVTYIKSDDSYRVTTFTEKNVPIFGPPLPCPTVFHNHQEFRNFLLVKLINGEKAAYSSPIFSSRRQRTLESLITRLCQEHMHEKIGVRKSWGDAISDQTRGNKRKETEREQIFMQYGQSLKLKTIVKGDAPTSLITTSANVKVEPWQQQNVYEDFPHKIFCGDSWGDALVLGTENGVYVVVGDTIRQLFDKSIVAKQLSVVEAYGLVLLRVEKGKEFHNSRICVFKLFDFEDEEQVAIAKDDCKQHKLAKTKGCHLYAVNHTNGSQPLFMGVACGRKVLLLKWKYPVVWSSSAAPSRNTRDLIEGFLVVKEVTINDSPLLMTVIQAPNKEPLICVGYKYCFDIVRHTGETTRIHSVDTLKKTTLVSAVDVYEEEEPELLLSFNHQSVFKKLNGEQSSNFYFNWNSAPRYVVCAFPYLLAFTNTTIEIRLVVNGNLVHTLALPKLELITSKWDIYFSASPPKPRNMSSSDQHNPSLPSPSSTTIPREHSCIYKISLYTLMGQFLSPTLKTPEELPDSTEMIKQGRDSEDGDQRTWRDSLEPPNSEDKPTMLSHKKDAISRTRSCPIPLHETLTVFSEEVDLWNRREDNDTEKQYNRTLKT